MFDILHYEFMRNAFAAGLLASIICGIMGTLVVINRIVFLSGGIAHAAYGGIGMAFFFGWPYMVGTIGFSFVAAMIMAVVTIKAKHRSDTIIGVIWAVGMAIGIVLLDLTPGYNVDLMSYLFGSILTVPRSDIWVMIILGVLIVLFVGYHYYSLISMSYDEEFARIRGINVRLLYFTMVGMLAAAIVMVIQVVGLILVIALLTISPFMVEKFAKSMFQMMIFSSMLNIVFTISGLILSYRFNLTSGASIILVAGTAFLISLLIEQIVKQRKKILVNQIE